MRPDLHAAALVGLTALWACSDAPAPTSREALEGATYLTRATETGSITLSDGTATSVGETTTEFRLATVAEGDLDFDGEPDAAVIIVEDDGQAEYLHLHALLSDGRATEDVSARLVGDRIEVRRLSIDDGIVRVDLMLRAPGEPVMVRPSVPYSAHFALTDRGLVAAVQTEVEALDASPEPGESPEQRESRASADPVTIYGYEWALETFEMGDWSGDPTDGSRWPTLRFVAEMADVSGASGQLAGSAGCNRVFGSFRAEADGTLLVSGLAATRRSCRTAAMDLEKRFLAALKSVDSYRVEGEALEIEFGGGTMRFRLDGRVHAAEPTAFEEGIEPSVPAVSESGRRSA